MVLLAVPLLIALLAVIGAVLRGHPAPSPLTATAWILPGIDKVAPDDGPVRAASGPTVIAARGETRGFQLAVRLDRLAAASVSFGAWRGPSSLGTPQVYAEGTVPIERRSSSEGRPHGLGAWPDVLVPVTTARGRLDAGTTAFWIDVTVPRDARPGDYELPVEVDAGGHHSSLTARVQVSAARPAPALAGRVGLTTNDPSVETVRTLARFRLPASQYPSRASELPALLPFEPFLVLPGSLAMDRRFSEVQDAYRMLAGLGLANRAIAYVADEPSCDRLDEVQVAAHAAHAIDPHLTTLVTIGPNQCDGKAASTLRDVDLFVPTERNAEAAWSSRVRQWIYPNNAQVAGKEYTTFAIDTTGAANLLTAWRANVLGATGVLYWRADIWVKGGDPRRNAWPSGTGQQYNGDGVLVYPGGEPSLRLALFREGAEDYDLAHCAGAEGTRIMASIAPASNRFTTSSAKILHARAQLASACASALSGG